MVTKITALDVVVTLHHIVYGDVDKLGTPKTTHLYSNDNDDKPLDFGAH